MLLLYDSRIASMVQTNISSKIIIARNGTLKRSFSAKKRYNISRYHYFIQLECLLPTSSLFNSKSVPGNYTFMNSVQPLLLEHILEHMPVGVVILDCTSLRILYINTYLQSLLPSP